MDEDKILIICTDIYNKINETKKNNRKEITVSGKLLDYLEENNCYFVGDEHKSDISDVVNKLNSAHQFKIIFIHKGPNDTYLENLKGKLPSLSYKIEGFHTTDEILIERFKCFNWEDIIKDYNNKKLNKLSSEILFLFLPLDIDMQALEILSNKKRNGETKKTPVDYLNEMYADDVNYLQKLVDLQYFVNGINNGASEKAKSLSKGQSLDKMKGLDKEKLYHLSGITNSNVRQFFMMLDEKKDLGKVLGHDWGSGITSFHEWYCKLADCLRNKKE